MHRTKLHYALLLIGALYLSACGGGSLSSSNQQPRPTGTAIAVKFTGGAPLAIAEEIGTGNWTTASLQNGALGLTVPQGTSTYAIAYLCPTWQGMGPVSSEYVLQATIKDATSYSVTCYVNPTLGTISGSANVSAIANATQFRVYGAQGISSNVVTATSGPFSFQAPTGTNDIAVVAYDSSNNLVGVKFVRNQTVPGAVSSTITLSSNDATTSTQTMADSNIQSGFLPTPAGPYAEYATANGTFFYLSNVNTNTTQYPVMPASEVQSGDYYYFSSNDANSSNQHVLAWQSVTTPAPITLAFPNPLSYAAPTPAKFPTFTVNYGGFSGASAVSYAANIQWITNATDNGITVTATAAYLNGATNIAIPDLTSLSGFLPSPVSGSTIYWFVYGYGGTYQTFTPMPAPANIAAVQNTGTYTQP